MAAVQIDYPHLPLAAVDRIKFVEQVCYTK